MKALIFVVFVIVATGCSPATPPQPVEPPSIALAKAAIVRKLDAPSPAVFTDLETHNYDEMVCGKVNGLRFVYLAESLSFIEPPLPPKPSHAQLQYQCQFYKARELGSCSNADESAAEQIARMEMCSG